MSKAPLQNETVYNKSARGAIKPSRGLENPRSRVIMSKKQSHHRAPFSL
jgi:hypothetical protein